MPMVDPFTPSAFSLQTLTAAINNLPYRPGRLGALGLFQEKYISTLQTMIESRNGVLSLVDIKPRGAPGTPVHGESRGARPFAIPHIPATAALLADEVQGVRAFGSDNQAEVLQTRLNERLQQMRTNIDYTLEAHRLAALMGNYYDVNGSTQSLFTEFGVVQQTQSMALSPTASSKAREKAELVKEKVETALDGIPYSGIHVFCSPGFWRALLEDKDNKESVLNWQAAATLRSDTRDVIDLNGLTYERYRGTNAVKVTDDCAYAVPLGVMDLFMSVFAPANYDDAVNRIAETYYAKAERMEFDKGYKLEAQTNALNICTRPASVIKLTIS